MLTRRGRNLQVGAYLGSLKTRAPWLLRWAVAGLVVGGALGTKCGALSGGQAPGELERVLGHAAGVHVGALAFEASGGKFSDWLWGRGLFFEGRPSGVIEGSEDDLRDIFHARVSMLPNGKVTRLLDVHNMTRTTDADERDLTVSERYVYYATRAEPSSFTLLKRVDGVPSLEGRIREFLRSGSFTPYERTHVYPGPEVREVAIEGTAHGDLRLTERSAESLGAGVGESSALKLEREPWPNSPFWHLSADVARAVVGVEAVAQLEQLVFLAQAELTQWTRGRGSAAPTPKVDRQHAIDSVQLPTAPPNAPEPAFPPEGTSLDWTPAPIPRRPGKPLAFVATVRLDDPTQGETVILALFDMARLELGMSGGYREPEPETGPPDRGHVPSEPEVFSRIIATFNGGFQSAHGAFGMKVDGRLLVRPRPGLATVRVDQDGRVGFGTWREEDSPESPRSFRQNLPPLLTDGVFDPERRGHFGDHLLAGGVLTERTGLCVTREGHLVYAWGKAIDPRGLAEAMKRGGCRYAMHLDMNPGHCSLSFHFLKSFQPLSSESLLLTPEMKANPERLLKWSPKDFFYLAVRPPQAPVQREWRPSQTEPFVERIAAWRRTWSIRPGSKDGGQPAPLQLSPDGVAYRLGHRTHGSRPGLFATGRWLVPGHRGFATLELTGRGEVFLRPPGETGVRTAGATQIGLPTLLEGGELTSLAREVGDHRARAGLCQPSPGNLLIASLVGDSPLQLAEMLRREGCSLAVLLDRGSHHAAERRSGALGTTSTLEAGPDPESSWLVFEPRPERASAYVF